MQMVVGRAGLVNVTHTELAVDSGGAAPDLAILLKPCPDDGQAAPETATAETSPVAAGRFSLSNMFGALFDEGEATELTSTNVGASEADLRQAAGSVESPLQAGGPGTLPWPRRS